MRFSEYVLYIAGVVALLSGIFLHQGFWAVATIVYMATLGLYAVEDYLDKTAPRGFQVRGLLYIAGLFIVAAASPFPGQWHAGYFFAVATCIFFYAFGDAFRAAYFSPNENKPAAPSPVVDDHWKDLQSFYDRQFRGNVHAAEAWKAFAPKLTVLIRSDVSIPDAKPFLLHTHIEALNELASALQIHTNEPVPDDLYDYRYQPFASSKVSALVPFLIKASAVHDQDRFEHAWLLGPQGSGKTQLLQYLIAQDIERVKKGECSIIVMDSQGDLIKNIQSLAVFDNEMKRQLVVIEPDPEHPLALNPFDMGKQRLSSYDARSREMLINSTLDLLTYVFGALGDGAEMTPKQSTLYRYCIRLLMEIPRANLETFQNILKSGVSEYQPYINRLEPPAQSFFANEFSDKKLFETTKQEVSWRLSLMLENRTFARMFNAPESKLDLFEEMSSGKVILINTDKALLGEERTALFGRFFIALILQASQERANVKRDDRLPTFVYVDECQDYIAGDSKVATILDQARKMKVGMLLANQRSQQITNPNVLDALLTTSIKFVHTDNDRDTHLLSRVIRMSPEAIASLPEQVFAYHLRGHGSIGVKAPLLYMEKLPHMNAEGLREQKKRMQERYARPITSEPAATPSPKPKNNIDL